MRALLVAAALLLVLTACGTDSSEPDPVTEPAPPAETPAAAPPEADDPPDEPQPAAPPEPEPTLLRPTPELPEGPYYPSAEQRPSDRDADLLLLSGSPAIASGDPLQLDGQLLDVDGEPVAGALIELWQTDVQGIYLHPDDLRASQRDPYFQSFGETESDQEGRWGFRTIVPAPYDDRPRHLHVKVWLDGAELLTSQIFFASDLALDADQTVAEIGDQIEAVTISPEPGTDAAGLEIQTATHIIVVDVRRAG